MTPKDPIPARLAALKSTSTPDLKQQWRDLFDSEPRQGQALSPLCQLGRDEAWRRIMPGRRVPATEIEGAVIDQLRAVFRQLEIVAAGT